MEEKDNIEVVNSTDTQKEVEQEQANADKPEEKDIPKDDEKSEEEIKDGENQDEKKEEKPKKKSRAQKRIERQQRENIALREEIERLKTQTPKKEKEVEEIDPDAYDTYEEYLDALAESEIQEPKQEQQTEAKPQIDTKIEDMFEDGNEDYEDFDEKVKAPDLPLTEQLLSNVLESESPADVAYYLANNKDLTKKLAGMSDKKQLKEIAKIELKLENKEEKKEVEVSKAPAPIEPLDGGRQPVKSLDDDGLSYEEYEKLLNSKNKANNGGFL